MVSAEKWIELTKEFNKLIECYPTRKAEVNSLMNNLYSFTFFLSDLAIDHLIDVTKTYTQPKTEGNMTTIEMLKELVENGGMFESDAPKGTTVVDYIAVTDRGIAWIMKHDNLPRGLFELEERLLNSKWRPYVKLVDWTKVPIDTKVLCRDGNKWHKRHYAGIVNGNPCAWDGGCTSWGGTGSVSGYIWDEMKLAE